MPRMDQMGDLTCAELTFEWRIRYILSLSIKPSDSCTSASFHFADSLWHLRLYLNDEGSEGWVSLFLTREEAGPPKTIKFRFGLKVFNRVVQKWEAEQEFTVKGEGYGFPYFLSIDQLYNQALMPDGVLTVRCLLRSASFGNDKDPPPMVTDQAVQSTSAEQTVLDGEKKLLKSLLGMLESGEGSDVLIKVRGKEFPAHRAILRSRSNVFHSMFAHDMVERNSGVVKIEDCDPDVFQDFLFHIYSGRCDRISPKNVCGLYTAADKYDVGELKEACSKFVQRNITVECFCGVIALALKQNDSDLIERATEFFCNNTVDIVKTPTWQTFLTENPTVGNELFLKAISKDKAQ